MGEIQIYSRTRGVETEAIAHKNARFLNVDSLNQESRSAGVGVSIGFSQETRFLNCSKIEGIVWQFRRR
jgi:hypothetical protein